MALTRFHLLSDEEYNNARLLFLSIAEGTREYPYLDTDIARANPTIGIGFNLAVETVLTAVLKDFGFDFDQPDPNNQNEKFQHAIDVKSQKDIHKIVTKYYSPSSLHDHPQNGTLRTNLDKIMTDRVTEMGKKSLGTEGAKTSFAYDSLEEMQGAFNSIVKTYETKLDIWLSGQKKGGFPGNLSKTNIGPVPFSRERIALFSLAFNTKDGKTSLLGKNLATALDNNNRAEAWYEIRYNSNGNKSGGIAKRRFAESSLFGLYEPESIWDDADHAWYEEAKWIFAMVEDHREKILLRMKNLRS